MQRITDLSYHENQWEMRKSNTSEGSHEKYDPSHRWQLIMTWVEIETENYFISFHFKIILNNQPKMKLYGKLKIMIYKKREYFDFLI